MISLLFPLNSQSNVFSNTILASSDHNDYNKIIIDESKDKAELNVYLINKQSSKNISSQELLSNIQQNEAFAIYRIPELDINNIISEYSNNNSKLEENNFYHIIKEAFNKVTPSAILINDSSLEYSLYELKAGKIDTLSCLKINKNYGSSENSYPPEPDKPALVNDDNLKFENSDPLAEGDTETDVFGIFLLPSIKQVHYDATDLKLKLIQELSKLNPEKINNKGWLKSKHDK